MKICIFSTTFFPTIGGAEQVIHNLGESLTRLGHEVVTMVPTKGLKSFDPNYQLRPLRIPKGVVHLHQKTPPRGLDPFIWSLRWNLWQVYREHNFDILQVVLTYPAGYALMDWDKTPVVVRGTGDDIQKLPEINYGLRLNPWFDRRIREVVKKVDGLVANSPSMREAFLDAGAESSKIKVIPNGVTLNRFKRRSTDLRERLNLPPNSTIILSVGRNHRKKDYETLVKAMLDVRGQQANVCAVIIGSGTETLEPLISKLNLNDRVILTGRMPATDKLEYDKIPSRELVDAYLSADLFVFPTLMEGLPNVLIEAMAAGLPIVSTEAPGVVDLIEDGRNGVLVPPREPQSLAREIKHLLSDTKHRERLGEAAKKEAQKYAWQRIAQQYLQYYEYLVSRANN